MEKHLTSQERYRCIDVVKRIEQIDYWQRVPQDLAKPNTNTKPLTIYRARRRHISSTELIITNVHIQMHRAHVHAHNTTFIRTAHPFIAKEVKHVMVSKKFRCTGAINMIEKHESWERHESKAFADGEFQQTGHTLLHES